MSEPERATQEEIDLAREIHASQEITIDDDAEVERLDGGYWVRGWLWVSEESKAASEFGGLP